LATLGTLAATWTGGRPASGEQEREVGVGIESLEFLQGIEVHGNILDVMHDTGFIGLRLDSVSQDLESYGITTTEQNGMPKFPSAGCTW